MAPSTERNWTWTVLILAGVLFCGLSWLQFFSFNVPAVDFSIFDQMIPNTAYGRFMYSAACGADGCNHFGVHSTPILFFFYPLHRLFGHPLFFVTLHALTLWSAAIPLSLLTRDKVQEPWHRIAILLTFFCSPFFLKILDYQFHPEVFYVPLFLWFVYLVERRKTAWLWLVSLLILSVKEDGAVYLSAAVLAAALTRRMRIRNAAALIAMSIAVFMLNIGWVIPWNSDTGAYHLAGTSSRFGSTPGEMVRGMATHAGEVLASLLRGAWLKELFRFFFLPLLDPFFVIAVLPFALIHSVAGSPVMRGLATYYSAPYLPWIFAGFVLFLSRERWPLSRRPLGARAKSLLVAFAFLSSFPAWFAYHPLRAAMSAREVARYSSFVEMRGAIDPTRSICAQGSIFPHLGYLRKMELLKPACLDHGLDYYVLNPKLGYWPLSQEEMIAIQERLDRNPAYHRQDFGSFILYIRTGAPGSS